MAETVEQYIKRIQGHVEGKDPLKVQKSTHRKIEKLISRLNKKQLRRRPAKGKWSIAEILAHLADAELVGGWRLRMILTHNGTPIQAFDQDSWASTFRYADRDPKQSLKMFRVLRTNNLALLESVPRQLWGNRGPPGAHVCRARPESPEADRADCQGPTQIGNSRLRLSGDMNATSRALSPVGGLRWLGEPGSDSLPARHGRSSREVGAMGCAHPGGGVCMAFPSALRSLSAARVAGTLASTVP